MSLSPIISGETLLKTIYIDFALFIIIWIKIETFVSQLHFSVIHSVLECWFEVFFCFTFYICKQKYKWSTS